jgi:hypothetical protein
MADLSPGSFQTAPSRICRSLTSRPRRGLERLALRGLRRQNGGWLITLDGTKVNFASKEPEETLDFWARVDTSTVS